MNRQFNPSTMPPPGGNYSHGCEVPPGARGLVVAGQIGIKPDGTLADSVDGKCEWAFRNILGVLEAADMGPQDITKLTTYVTDRSIGQAFADARAKVLGDVKPPSTFVVVAGLGQPSWLIEIEATAARSP
jgi:enamine deaminase RidA (YjgF/YER057c/UK114 family)